MQEQEEKEPQKANKYPYQQQKNDDKQHNEEFKDTEVIHEERDNNATDTISHSESGQYSDLIVTDSKNKLNHKNPMELESDTDNVNILTDDMFVLEVPSFVVPVLYEKPSITPFREFVDNLGKQIDDELITKQKEKENELSKESPGTSRNDDNETLDSDIVSVLTLEEINRSLKIALNAGPKKINDYFSDFFSVGIGKLCMSVGENVVQQRVNEDLLKQTQALLSNNRKAQTNTNEIECNIRKQFFSLNDSMAEYLAFRCPRLQCMFCNFTTESKLVLAFHLETPHFINNLHNCNFCSYKENTPEKVLTHMASQHNMLGRVEKDPASSQCCYCPFEDNNKLKVETHQNYCRKQFQQFSHLAPPLDWEPPAKVTKRVKDTIFPNYTFEPEDVPISLTNSVGHVKIDPVYNYDRGRDSDFDSNDGRDSSFPRHPQYDGQDGSSCSQHLQRNDGKDGYSCPRYPRRNGGQDGRNCPRRNNGQDDSNYSRHPQRYDDQDGSSCSRHPQRNDGKDGSSCSRRSDGQDGSSCPRRNDGQDGSSSSRQPQRNDGQDSNSYSTATNETGTNLKLNVRLVVLTPDTVSIPLLPIIKMPRTTKIVYNQKNLYTFAICEICDDWHEDSKSLDAHLISAHGLNRAECNRKNPPLTCKKCNCRFLTVKGLERHLLGVHGLVTFSLQAANRTGTDFGYCPGCSELHRSDLLGHFKKNHLSKIKKAITTFECMVCQEVFLLFKQFQEHVLADHGNWPKIIETIVDSKPTTIIKLEPDSDSEATSDC